MLKSEHPVCSLMDYGKAKNGWKRGIYHALYADKLITKDQLYALLNLLPP